MFARDSHSARKEAAVPPRVTHAAVASLPPIVQRHLAFAGVVGSAVPPTVSIRQEGEIRLRPGARWMPFVADQQYTTAEPSFTWLARMKPLPGVSVRAQDELTDGHGAMQVWPMPFWKAVDARGPEMDQGSITRFMNEMMWFPAAYVLPYVSWEAIDDASAAMRIDVHGTIAHAVVSFASDGALINFVTDRYRTAGRDRWDLAPWSTPILRSALISGVRVPVEGEGVWHLADGDFAYIRIRLTGLTYL